MKTFEEILLELLEEKYGYSGKITIHNMIRIYPNLWETINEAANNHTDLALQKESNL